MPSAITIPVIANSTLNTVANEVGDFVFIGRVAVASAGVADQVFTEDPAYYNDTLSGYNAHTPTPGQHSARVKFASLVTSSPLAYATNSIVYAVVADLVTNSSSTDEQIYTRVAAVWNNLSETYLT